MGLHQSSVERNTVNVVLLEDCVFTVILTHGKFLILHFPHRGLGAIMATLRRTKHRVVVTCREGGVSLLVHGVYDYFRSYLFMVIDAVFRLRLIFSSAGMWDLTGRGIGTARRMEDDESPLQGRGGRRRSLPSSRLPELEMVSPDSNIGNTGELKTDDALRHALPERQEPWRISGINNENVNQQISHSWDCDQLEPAFLREDAYPTGWLVYDPTYGVILKEVADEKRNKSLKEEQKII